jgi:hypothetical protein
MSDNVDRALKRPAEYSQLSPDRQWEIDKKLGILDWDPTAEEIKEYKQKIKNRK